MNIFELLGWPKAEKPREPTHSTWDDTGSMIVEETVSTYVDPTTLCNVTFSTGRQIDVQPAKPQKVVDPAKLAIAEKHAAMAARRREEKALLKDIVKHAPSEGIEFVHTGDTTFAWKYKHGPEDGYVRNKKIIEVSTAVCNPTDQYAKWFGSAVAARNLLEGKSITLRIPADYKSPRDALVNIGFMLEPCTCGELHGR